MEEEIEVARALLKAAEELADAPFDVGGISQFDPLFFRLDEAIERYREVLQKGE